MLKVEHPNGDPARTHGWNREGHGLWWKVIARNKRAITLNLGRPEGQELLRELVADADVIVENFRPGVMEKWGLGPDTLLDVNPRLVMLRVTGFGQEGPYAERRAFGTLMEAVSGFAHQTGQEDGPPTLPPFGLADGVAGIAGAYAVLTALYHRDLRGGPDGGGRGQVIDLALLEPLLGILGPGPTVYDQLGIIAGRHGNRSPNNAPRNAYVTRDGRWVAIHRTPLRKRRADPARHPRPGLLPSRRNARQGRLRRVLHGRRMGDRRPRRPVRAPAPECRRRRASGTLACAGCSSYAHG